MKATTWGACLGLLAVMESSCSLAFVRGPPDRPVAPDAQLTCTTSNLAPVLDVVAGSGTILLFAAASSGSGSSSSGAAGFGNIGPSTRDVAPFFALTSLLFLGSGLLGLGRTRDCRRVVEAQRACVAGGPAACLDLQRAPLAPSPPPEAAPRPTLTW